MDTMDLVDRIYEAAVVHERWPTVLQNIAVFAGGFGTLLSVVSPTGRSRFITSSSAMDELTRAHLETFPDNVRTSRLLAKRHAGFIVDLDVLTEDEMAAAPIYRDYLHPRGFGYGAATAIHVPTGDATVVHIEGYLAKGPILSQTVSRLDGLRPHLARAALIANRLETQVAGSAVSALELVGLPAAVLNDRGKPLAANELFQRLIPAAVEELPRRLRWMDAGADELFVNALTSDPRQATVRSIPMRAFADLPPIVIHLVPINFAARDVFSRAEAILIVTPVEPKPSLGPDLVEGLFDLTAAEAKLAALIAGGHPPRDAANILSWTEATTRTTLKKVFAKTGVNRQADLVALLSGLAPSRASGPAK